MADRSKIEWTEASWNPVTGCEEVSPGCDHCYAKTFAERWRGTPGHAYANGFDLTLRPNRLDQPLRWTRPRRVFVNSMSDLFHKDIPDEYIGKVFAVMAATPRHTYQLLTKRHGRMRALLNNADWRSYVFQYESVLDLSGRPRPLPVWPLPNVWLGVSVEDQQRADLRIPALFETPAAVRWLSMEPLLGPVDLTGINWRRGSITHLDVLNGRYGVPELWQQKTDKRIDWVVVGGESGPGARPMHPYWARSVRDQCVAAGVPFFFKQHGEWGPLLDVFDYVTNDDRVQVVDTAGRLRGRPWPGWKVQDGTRDAEVLRRYGKKTAGRELDGRTWDEYPAVADV